MHSMRYTQLILVPDLSTTDEAFRKYLRVKNRFISSEHFHSESRESDEAQTLTSTFPN